MGRGARERAGRLLEVLQDEGGSETRRYRRPDRFGRHEIVGQGRLRQFPRMSQVSRFVLVLVLDGLRPDAITREDTPTLFRLRQEGVSFADSHAVFPTVTRVNATAITTGTQPGTNGIVGNSMYVPALDEHRAFDTAAFQNLLRL